MKNIDIIGGSGFIGTRLVRRLRRNKNVNCKIIDKALSGEFPDLVTLVDVNSLSNLTEVVTTGSIIVNLAAEHRDDVRPPSLYSHVNVDGAKNICLAASKKSANTIIFTSSVAIYGFALVGTDEAGSVLPFNEYGRSKYDAEQVFKMWQAEVPDLRTLVIIRPTVVFGEQNRGNVYNLFRQVANKRFLMVGSGENRKSMAYVENVAAFIEYSMSFAPGVHVYNYIDKPDLSMNSLVGRINCILGRPEKSYIRIHYLFGLLIGRLFDLASLFTSRRFIISAIRVKKFCANSVYNTKIDETGFVAPVSLQEALERTIKYEFMESHEHDQVFYTE